MPVAKERRSKEKPLIGKVDLQTMRYHLDQYVNHDGANPPDDILKDRMPKIRAILADERFKGHYGYAGMKKTENMDHARLQAHASVLLDWIERWLR